MEIINKVDLARLEGVRADVLVGHERPMSAEQFERESRSRPGFRSGLHKPMSSARFLLTKVMLRVLPEACIGLEQSADEGGRTAAWIEQGGLVRVSYGSPGQPWMVVFDCDVRSG